MMLSCKEQSMLESGQDLSNPILSQAEESTNNLSALLRQVGSDHYKTQAIQPIEYIMANNLGFCEGNVVKYITRYKQKGGVEDLDKVIHYVEFIKEFLDAESKHHTD